MTGHDKRWAGSFLSQSRVKAVARTPVPHNGAPYGAVTHEWDVVAVRRFHPTDLAEHLRWNDMHFVHEQQSPLPLAYQSHHLGLQ